jgi:lauroyl/myristoyl acyltransferase
MTPLSTLLRPRYWLTWIGLFVLRVIEPLPYRVQRYVATALGILIRRLALDSVRVARRNIRLRMRFMSRDAQESLLTQHCQSLGMGICETANSWWSSNARVKCSADIRGGEHLVAALAGRRGAILLGGGFTTADIVARILSTQTRLNVRYRRPRNAVLANIMLRRLSCFENLISQDNTRGLADALSRGEAVWYPLDPWTLNGNAGAVDGLDLPTATSEHALSLAHTSGAAVLPCFAERLPGTLGYCIDIGPALDDVRGSNLARSAMRFNAQLEAHIQRVPEQYLWA